MGPVAKKSAIRNFWHTSASCDASYEKAKLIIRTGGGVRASAIPRRIPANELRNAKMGNGGGSDQSVKRESSYGLVMDGARGWVSGGDDDDDDARMTAKIAAKDPMARASLVSAMVVPVMMIIKMMSV